MTWLGAACLHATSYFLLADDHALLAQAAGSDLRGIFGKGLFGVYRPLGFVVTRVVHAAMSPGMSGWSAVVLGMHALTAALVGVLGMRLGQSKHAAATGAVAFLWSPWGSEAYLWFSGIFDVGAALFVVVGCLLIVDGPAGRNRSAAWFAVAACACAALFKENGYLAPALAAVIALGGSARLSRQAIASLVVAVAVAVALFVLRGRILSAVETPYNAADFARRLLSPDVIPVAASNVRGLLLWPAPAVWADLSRVVATLLVWPAGAAIVAGLVTVALLRRPRAWWLGVALVVSLAPTASFVIDVQTITPRRYLYLPGVPLCLLLASAFGPGAARDGRRGTAAPDPHVDMQVLAAVTVILASAVAVSMQVALWRSASATARCAMRDFERRVLGRPGSHYVDNMPFALDRGPFILLEYDFTYLFGTRWKGTDVAFRRAVLTMTPSGALAVDGFAEAPADATKRTAVTLDLCLGRPR